MTASEIIGAAIRRARKGRGWSSARLGEEVGRSSRQIVRIERGECLCSTTLDDVLAALDAELVVEVREERAAVRAG